MGKKILIIDDETDVATMLMYRLRASGYEVIMASTGKEGILKAETEQPDLILLDYKLPDIRSAEIVEQLKFSSQLAAVPVILITASVEEIAEKAQECKASDYIAKPIGPEELMRKVRAQLLQ